MSEASEPTIYRITAEGFALTEKDALALANLLGQRFGMLSKVYPRPVVQFQKDAS